MAELVGISNLNWKLSASEIGQETDQLIENTRKVYDQIGSLKQQDVCFENTIKVDVVYIKMGGSVAYWFP
jgi:thimet oligopeptidase